MADDLLAFSELADREFRGDARGVVQAADALFGRDIAGGIAQPGQPGHVGLDDVECRGGRGSGVKSVAAHGEDARTSRSGQRVGRGDHAVYR